jgi:hypothetical protein
VRLLKSKLTFGRRHRMQGLLPACLSVVCYSSTQPWLTRELLILAWLLRFARLSFLAAVALEMAVRLFSAYLDLGRLRRVMPGR